MRLIDADAIIEEFCDDCAYKNTAFCDNDDPVCGTASWIAEAPTIDAVVRGNGHWIKSEEANGMKHLMIEYYDCSECGEQISDRYGLYPYCPYCGAKMAVEDEDN